MWHNILSWKSDSNPNVEATVNTTVRTAIDLHFTHIILMHIFLHTLYCINQRHNLQATYLKTVFQLYLLSERYLAPLFVFSYFTDDTLLVVKAIIQLHQITDNACFATRHPKHKPELWSNPEKHRQKSWQQRHGGSRCDASFDFTTRPPQNICKCAAVTLHGRAGELQPSEWRTSAYQDVKRTNTRVAPSQKKKKKEEKQSVKVMTKWLNTKAISSLLFLHQKQTKYLPRRMLHSSHVGRISIQICCSCVTGIYLHLKSVLAQNTQTQSKRIWF